ncbi:cilia- and flagella-associated protein 69 isoform X3 [Anas platyrhynchos]|uniref:cilia- and flagella-associated protein 69 isoform X3 n=1 Tax=Anas platyrhynchos TaxID=8839 RepID=UPI003AF29C65
MESISMMGSPKNLNETFLPNVANGIKDASKITIGIIGSGDFAKSLTIRLIRCGYHVVVGSRNPKLAAEFFPHVVDVTHHEDAVAKANIIFVAIHREHYASLWDLKHLLIGKILVDVSNNTRVDQYPDSNAEYLASLFPDSLVVKGFNVVSAWSLQLGPKDASRQVYICSNNVQARHQVTELARQLGFIPIDLGALSSSREIENLPLRLFTLWKGPVVLAISLATFFFIYSFIRDVIHPYVRNQQSDFYKIPIEIVNKTLPIVAITLLSLVYLSGLIAAAYQLYYGTKYRRFPPWLDNWLQCRKQLGLLSFFFATVHVVYSLCLPMRRSERYLFLNMAYQQVHANVENSWNEEEVWRIEMYISFGIMSLGLLSLLAVTSIPSVNSALNWREFSFIQSTLGYVALIISTFHVLIYGWKRAFEEEYYRFYTPPNFVLALVLPSIVILVRLPQSHSYLQRCLIVKCVMTKNRGSASRFPPAAQQESLHCETRSADLNHAIRLLGDSDSSNLEEKQLKVLKKVVKRFENGLPLKDLAQIIDILNLCAEKVNEQEAFIEPVCELIKLCGLPFQKKKLSDEVSYSVTVSKSIAQLGYLMRVPSSQVRIQICKCIISFYKAELPRKLLSGYQPTSANYKTEMAELGGLAETFVLSLAIVENELTEKLWVLKVLQHLSSSGVNCRHMLKAQAASRLCLYLNDVDPSGQLVFRSSEILWNLLENTSKEEVVNQLSSLECVHALKEVFVDLLLHGFRHYDRQLRNDLLVIATLVAENPAAPMIESGFATLLIVLATYTEDPFFGQGNSFHGTGGRGNKLAQMRYSLRVLRSVVSLYDDAVNLNLCDQGAISQLLDILKYAANKSKERDDAILLEIQADTLFILSALCENDAHRKELFSYEGVDILIPFIQMDPKKLYSGLGHNRLLFNALDCLWSCVVGCYIGEDYFLEQQGIFILLDLLALKQKNLCNIILGLLVEFCDNPRTTFHISTWRGEKDQTAANLLIQLWRQEELDLGVKRDRYGRIADVKRPIVGSFQKQQEVIPMPANSPTFAIVEISENIRAKLYLLLCKLGFEDLPGLSAKDFVTLAIIRRYVDFKVGEVWSEVCTEIKEEFRPVASDEEALKVISEVSENVGRSVAALQTEVLESQHRQEIREEEKTYTKIQAVHKQKEMVNKSWENFLTRTSNYEALKKAKRLQEKSIEASRSKLKTQNGAVHSTDIKGLSTTIGSGRLVTVESTPSQLIGGPLSGTDLALGKPSVCEGALKKIKRVKTLDSIKKDLGPVE